MGYNFVDLDLTQLHMGDKLDDIGFYAVDRAA